jgi:hypothetical protein
MSLTSYRAAPPRVVIMFPRKGMRERVAGLAATYSSAAGAAVPSAQRVFTAEFGMGSGVWPRAMATRPARLRGAAGGVARVTGPGGRTGWPGSGVGGVGGLSCAREEASCVSVLRLGPGLRRGSALR